jgi:hypothetical protein
MGSTAKATADTQERLQRTFDVMRQRAYLAGATGNADNSALYAEDSPIDLVLRGFNQAAVISRTGVDVGYHGCSLQTSAKGVDRFAYKVEHVLVRVAQSVVSATLAAHAQGASKTATLRRLGLAGENILTLRRLFAALGRAEDFTAADKASRRGHMAAGMIARHGVANPFELAEIQKAAEQTRLERYGGKYTFSEGSSLAKPARASFARHLAEKSFAEDLRRRKAATNLARYGVAVPSQSPVVRAKSRATSRERYGVDHHSQRPEFRVRQAALARADGKRRAAVSRRTNLERYEVEYVSQLPANRERQSRLMIRTHVERDAKARITTLQKYGVLYASQRQERRAAHSAFMRSNGVDFAARSRVTTLKRYGVAHHAQTEQRRMRQSRRMLDPEHQNRINAAKRANNSFNASASEEELHALLAGYFDGDVLRQHNDPRYPYRCDFYISSRDLFIELNGTWTHGGHWFDQGDPHDRQVVENWRAKNSAYYNAAILQWCRRDTAKRNSARDARLNYVTFWDGQRLDDARLWLEMGAPDGSDWQREYTWLPVRELTLHVTPQGSHEQQWATGLTAGTPDLQLSYQREIEAWKDNRVTRWGTLQAVLYSDRYHVLGKLPQELSELEILEGLAVNRLLPVVNSQGMRVARHGPPSPPPMQKS